MSSKSANIIGATSFETLDGFARNHLEKLMDHSQSPIASIYVSHQPGESGDTQAGRMKTAVNRARSLLEESGLRRDDAEQLLAPATAQVEALRSARGTRSDLALFVSQVGLKGFHIPHAVIDEVVVGHDPHILPLIGDLPPQSPTVIVSVSKNNTHAFAVTPWDISPIQIDGLPTSSDDVTPTGDREHMLQRRKIRPASGESTLIHGHGGAKDMDDIVREQFVHAVELSLQQFLRRRRDHLVLAAVAETGQELRARLASDQVIGVITGNYDHQQPALLRHDAQRVIDDARRQHQRERLAAFREHAGNSSITCIVDDVKAASEQGRIETLVLPQLDHFANVHGSVVATMNRAAIDTLLTSGSVIIAANDDADDLTLPAARLRF